MNKRGKNVLNIELFFISLTVFITVIVWIGVEIYQSNLKQKYSKNYESSLSITIEKIDDKKVIELLNQR